MRQSTKKGGANLVIIVGVIIVLLLIVFVIRNVSKRRALSPQLPSTTVDQAQELEDELDVEIGEIEDIEKELQGLESELQGL